MDVCVSVSDVSGLGLEHSGLSLGLADKVLVFESSLCLAGM